MTNDNPLDSFSEDFVLFIEAGFLAIKQADEDSAKKLFGAAKVLRPASVEPDIGLAYIQLNKLEIKEAFEGFCKVLEKDPENPYATSMKGISMMLQKEKRDEGKRIINQLIETAQDDSVKTLGKVALKWCEEDLSKDKSSLFST